ncbi:MAG: hypothetical protein QG641_2155, partial [Candidatus Poribacteria bacterium]|nr:hypothetical protein [Candidatus Poribacteria bacterium]
LKGKKFNLETDHRNIQYLKLSANDKVNRWKFLLADYNFKISYIPGKTNVIADLLSRSDDQNLENNDSKDDGKTELNSVVEKGQEGGGGEGTGQAPSKTTYEKFKCLHGQSHIRWNSSMDMDSKSYNDCLKYCITCQKLSCKKKNTTIVGRCLRGNKPFEIITADYLTVNSNPLLVVMDTMSKITQITACKENSTSAICALKTFISYYGSPRLIVVDSSTVFGSEEFELFCERNKMEIHFTTPHSHKSNGIVEHQNKEILLIVKKLEGASKDTDLEIVMKEMNSQRRPILKNKSPLEVLFNSENIQQTLNELEEEVKNKVLEEVKKDTYERFKEGDLVIRRNKDQRSKLKFNFIGPYFVITQRDPWHVEIKDILTGSQIICHFEDLELFNYDPELVSWDEILSSHANDSGQYVVEKVLAFDDKKGKVLIKWKGYSLSKATWENVRDVSTVEVVIEYFKRKDSMVGTVDGDDQYRVSV